MALALGAKVGLKQHFDFGGVPYQHQVYQYRPATYSHCTVVCSTSQWVYDSSHTLVVLAFPTQSAFGQAFS